jgi:BirA family biotin operon repressor/biotin-[acetyl-CoA-carboxylase] ligase
MLKRSSNDFLFRNFYLFDILSSTQDFAFDLISNSSSLDPSVVISDIQSGGKGRKGSTWASPEGGIWMSIVFDPCLKIDQFFFIVIMTSLLLCDIIESYIDKKPVIKWPNDILVERKKIAGILMDTQIQRGNEPKIILGMGINANNDLQETSFQIRKSKLIKYEITSMKYENLGKHINKEELMTKILFGLSDYLIKLNEKSFRNELLNRYKRSIEESSKDQQYTFTLDDKTFQGKIIKVYDDGSILVQKLFDSGMNNFIRIESAFNIN